MPACRIPPVSNNLDKIQLERLSYVSFEHNDLEQFDRFAIDFGFEIASKSKSEACYRGWGQDAVSYVALRGDGKTQRFVGATFIAKTERDFCKSAAIPGASEIKTHDRPGGGKIVTILSPSGSRIHILWGQQDRPKPTKSVSQTQVHRGAYNTPLAKGRKGVFAFDSLQ